MLHPDLAALAAELRGWSSTRMGQDDVIWKPPQAAQAPQTTVGFHRDADYISKQFQPYDNNMVTVWMALDDADEETGCIEYVAGSHKFTAPGQDMEELSSSTLSFFSGKEHEKESSHRDSLPPDMCKKKISRAYCPAGHAVFHHQDVWHGSGPNRSTSRHRRALVAHLLNGNVQWKSSSSSQESQQSALPPWTDASYIYGRYRRSGTNQLDEDFFPILYGAPGSGLSRTPWLDTYIGANK